MKSFFNFIGVEFENHSTGVCVCPLPAIASRSGEAGGCVLLWLKTLWNLL
jgi:hypothetical protein